MGRVGGGWGRVGREWELEGIGFGFKGERALSFLPCLDSLLCR